MVSTMQRRARFVLPILLAAASFAQVCDPALLRLVNPRNPVKYGPRGARCEGVYDPERSGASLLLVSYTSRFDDFDPSKAGARLHLRPSVPQKLPVHLRSYALRSRTYYQMDTRLEPPAAEFAWPVDVLGQIGLTRADLGVVGWTNYAGKDGARDVFVPVEVTAEGPARAQANYTLLLLPGRRLNEMYATVRLLRSDLSEVSRLLEERPLERGPYPAEIPVRISLEDLRISNAGIYSVRIGATASGDRPLSMTFLLYRP
jgi:hypothetical protein